jgi:plastocyanin
MLNIAQWMRYRRRLRLVCGGFGAAALLAATVPAISAGGSAAVIAAAQTATIKIDNFRFLPPDLTVPAGTTVAWKNDDDSPHRIAGLNGAYASAALDTDDSYTHTFATPGVYSYICSIHPYMKGKIVVTAPAPKS